MFTFALGAIFGVTVYVIFLNWEDTKELALILWDEAKALFAKKDGKSDD